MSYINIDGRADGFAEGGPDDIVSDLSVEVVEVVQPGVYPYCSRQAFDGLFASSQSKTLNVPSPYGSLFGIGAGNSSFSSTFQNASSNSFNTLFNNNNTCDRV